MRRIFGIILLIASVTTVMAAAGTKKRAVTFLTEPTLIVSTVFQGSVRITHDADKDARGEPCTTVEAVDKNGDPTGVAVSFHCIPLTRPAPQGFAVSTKGTDKLGAKCILTQFQFARDKEAHGVPIAN